jgi:pimeloyl-ACP methyl ester carboxylesterase
MAASSVDRVKTRLIAPVLCVLALCASACSSSSGSAGKTGGSGTTQTSTGAGGTTSSTTSGGNGASGASGQSGAGAQATSLAWHSCDNTFQCATLQVPVSYSDPAGPSIGIAVVELASTGSHPVGDIVFNPGGPGESGVQFLEQASNIFPASLRAQFNLVSFDPRGTGSSDPLQCLTPDQIRTYLALTPVPSTSAQINQVETATKGFVANCEKNKPVSFIESMSTANSARDMDRLRAALGQAKLTYYGFSYGTYLGTVYAEMFPSKVRAMVLDGAVDPALGNTALDTQQSLGFETDLHDFLNWCAAHSSCSGGLPAAPTKAFAELMRSFEKGKVIQANLQPAFGGTQPVDYGVALLGVLTALYSSSTWPILGTALSNAFNGDGSYLAALAYNYAGQNQDGTFSNILSADTATSCLDRPAPTSISDYKALAAQLEAVAPDFGGSEAWSTLSCAYWPAGPQTQPAPAHAPGAPPILVVGSTNDPATPYAWAKALASQLPHAVLLTRTGAGHTAYQFSSCVRNYADQYLETLVMPAAGTDCASS